MIQLPLLKQDNFQLYLLWYVLIILRNLLFFDFSEEIPTPAPDPTNKGTVNIEAIMLITKFAAIL